MPPKRPTFHAQAGLESLDHPTFYARLIILKWIHVCSPRFQHATDKDDHSGHAPTDVRIEMSGQGALDRFFGEVRFFLFFIKNFFFIFKFFLTKFLFRVFMQFFKKISRINKSEDHVTTGASAIHQSINQSIDRSIKQKTQSPSINQSIITYSWFLLIVLINQSIDRSNRWLKVLQSTNQS